MTAQPQSKLREILACLLCSSLYFQLTPRERLALLKSLAAQMEEREGPN